MLALYLTTLLEFSSKILCLNLLMDFSWLERQQTPLSIPASARSFMRGITYTDGTKEEMQSTRKMDGIACSLGVECKGRQGGGELSSDGFRHLLGSSAALHNAADDGSEGV